MRVAVNLTCYLMSSQHQSSQRQHRPVLVRRAPAPTSPLHTPPRSQSKRPHLVRRVTVPASPPRISPPPAAENEENSDENEENDENYEDEDLGHKRKRGCNLLRDALEEEVSKKRRKRGIVK